MFKNFAIAAIAGAAAFTVVPAHAGSTKSNIELCRAAFDAEPTLAVDGAKFKFVSQRGGGLKRLTFSMRADDTKETVECSVRRGEVVKIAWTGGGDTLASL